MKERPRGISAQLNSSHSSVTQPVGESRNIRRMEQIESLHMEFEDLKKKIKDVENKNQRIIENIHKRYDFKKKPTTMESIVDKAPIVYYEQPIQAQMENQSVNSNQSEVDFHIAKPIVRKTSNIRKNANPLHHQSMQYRKTEHQLDREHSEASSKSNYPLQKQTSSAPYYAYGASSQARTQQSPGENYPVSQFSQAMPFQMSMQFPPYPSMGYTPMEQAYQNNYQIETVIRKERDKIKLLEQELQEKQEESITLKRLQKRFKNLSSEYNDRVEDMLEHFMQKVVESRFGQIEKHVKKTENKLRRLQLVIKDKDQQFRSLKNINEHRIKRSNSRNKRDASPMTPTYNSLPRNPRRTTTSHQNQSAEISASKSKHSDNSKSSMQFEQIASKYEEMIKTKTKELEISDMKLKKKQKQLVDLSTKYTALELKLSEMEEIPRARHMSKFSSGQKEDNLLANLDFQSQKDAQIKQLSRMISDLELQINLRDQQLKDKVVLAQKLTKKVGDLQIKAKKNETQAKKFKQELKKLENVDKEDGQMINKLKRLENQLQSREKQFALTKDKCVKIQNEKIEKECENMTLTNRIKKIEQLLRMKQEKIAELEKIIQGNANNELPDLLERSVIIDKNEQHDLHQLQEQRERLEEELTRKEEELFKLKKSKEQYLGQLKDYEHDNAQMKKEIETLLIQNESMKINLKAIQFEKYSQKSESKASPLQKLLQQNECVSENEDNSQIREQLEQLRNKYEQSQRQLKAQKHESLQFNTKLIKMSSEVSYYRDLLAERESKYEKIRKQLEENKCMVSHLQQTIQDKENQLQIEKKQNSQKIMELQTQWLQFEQEMRTKQQLQGSGNVSSDLRSSRNFSEESFVGYKTTFNTMNAQNEHLNEKIKQAEKIIEIQKEMQTKIMNEYRSNVEKIKGQLRQKIKENQQLVEEVDNLRRRIKVIQNTERRMKSMAEAENKQGQNHGAKIYELQLELSELRQIKNKQEAVEQELFKQIAEKEQDNESLMRLISSKDKKIEELQDIIELKELNVNFNSNISSSNHRSSKIKDSLQSNSSLKYSMLSNNPNRTIDLELSQAGESFYEQNQSMISNVSEVFGRDEFPYEKMQLKRVEQRRLFEKTAAYIKSLKNAIEQKNKKIKLMEKKIESLRNSELIRKDIYEIKDMQDVQTVGDEQFKDYASVQNVRASSQRYRLKQLEHETKLTIQENYLLNNQIETLQDELLKAEEQENSLMKLKDLYKDEIKSLIKKNQEQAKNFEDQMKRQRQKVEQSESVQRMQALKLLFIRIMNVIVNVYNEPSKSKRVQEYRKELEDSSKVLFNFLNIEQSTREKLLNEIKK